MHIIQLTDIKYISFSLIEDMNFILIVVLFAVHVMFFLNFVSLLIMYCQIIL